jgi:hypothetical protein
MVRPILLNKTQNAKNQLKHKSPQKNGLKALNPQYLLTFAMPESGRLPSHLSSTRVILPFSWKMLTLLLMVVSLPMPLTL